MINFLNDLAKQLLNSLLIAVLATTLLYAQEKKSIPSIEKIYVHTDRTTYTLGESLWYKAYTVYAYNHILFNESNILYVELISPDSKIIARNKTFLEGGLGHGDFVLSDSEGVKPGIYQIRAYTNYSRNFDNDFVFKKEIEIIDVFEKEKDKETKAIASKPVASKTKEVLKNTFNLQFFPEGGSLLNNVQSMVAFKAVDAHGNPIEVEGKVVDSTGDMVAFFGSLHDGMGKFQLTPIKGKQYHAVISSKGKEIETQLPKVNDQGFVLQIKNIDDRVFVSVRTNDETILKQPNATLAVIGTTRGVKYFEDIFQLSETVAAFELPKTDFPEGISQITLYDANLKPQSERLLYIEKEQDVEVTLTTDKKQYEPLEKVTVNVSSKTKEGSTVPASYSLSCWDTNGATNLENYGISISSYFLMESDIRGRVNNPGYYFNPSNPKRLEYLDLLLLTQGWRDFLWKTLPKVTDSLGFKKENGLTVSGRVKALFGDKPKENYNVSLTVFSKRGLNGLRTLTDSDGKFLFKDLAFFGKTKIYLNSKNDKWKSSGMLVLDSLNQSPMAVDFKGRNISNFEPELNTIEETIYKKYVMNGVAPENILDEIEVIAKKPNPIESMNSNLFRGFVVDEKTPSFTDIFDLFRYAIPTLDPNTFESVKFTRNTGGALIVVNQNIILDPDPDYDGAIFVLDYLRGIMPDDVLKIEYDNSAVSTMIYGNQGRNGVINIYTKEERSNTSKNTFNSISEVIDGFYDARVFYSPEPNVISLERDNTTAVRNTLYWNPYIHPDQTGVSEANYYNTEVETTINVSLEGITATGIPVVVHSSYSVKR